MEQGVETTGSQQIQANGLKMKGSVKFLVEASPVVQENEYLRCF